MKIIWKTLGYETYTKILFRKTVGYSLNLKNPQTLNEKIQWMKIYGNLEQLWKYVDKYEVRAFVKKAIGEEFLIPLIGVYNKVEEIDFNVLPSSFIIKATHGSGWNIIVHQKEELDLKLTTINLSGYNMRFLEMEE